MTKIEVKGIYLYAENSNENDVIQETRLGFLPLKENLETWIQNKLQEYDMK